MTTIDSYVSTVSFDDIQNSENRYWFKNLPTNFNLPSTTVDKLINAGSELLEQSMAYKELVKDIGLQ